MVRTRSVPVRKRAGRVLSPTGRVRRIVGINAGRLVIAVAHPFLDETKRAPRCCHACPERVPEVMKAGFSQPRSRHGPLEPLQNLAGVVWLAGLRVRKDEIMFFLEC